MILRESFFDVRRAGARSREKLRSEVADLDFESNRVTIRNKKRVHGKLRLEKPHCQPSFVKLLAEWVEKHPGDQNRYA